jgi:hypothetical protein
MINDKMTRYSGFYLLITQTAHTFLIRPLIYGSLLRWWGINNLQPRLVHHIARSFGELHKYLIRIVAMEN